MIFLGTEKMALAPLPNLTLGAVVQQLDSGLHWFGPTISYSFPTSKLGLIGTSESSTFSALNANQQSKAVLALSLWDDLIAPSFVVGTPGATNIEFGNTKLAGVYAQTYFPTDGTVWFSSNASGADLITPVIGAHGFLTYIHELGHALGLDHMGDYNGAGNFTPNSYQDSTVLSVMSYFGPSWGSGVSNGEGLIAWADWIGADNTLYEPQTPMLNDIYAIQQIYGADPSTRTGNTVYGFHSTVGAASGGIYDFTSNLNPIMCIYDSSGIDTLDLSGWSTSSTISLLPGTFSSGNSMTNNISIAYSCVIENAVGGAGNDVLVGNDFNNTLDGGSGDDNLAGGAGADVLFGRDGYDLVSYYASTLGVNIDLSLSGPQSSAGDGAGDTLSGFEGINGSNTGNDVLTGDTGANSLFGYGGNDYITGGAGSDGLAGGDGFDFVSYYGSALGVTINLNFTGGQSSAGDGSGDTLSGVEGVIGSNIGNDVLTGDAGANWLFGYAGNDYITGGVGGDGIDGGDGYDFVSYYGSTLGVTINLNLSGAQSSAGDGSGDILSGLEGIDGSNLGNDVLTGNSGANWLNGYAGNDYITGGAGADWLLGGDGFDFVSYFGSALGVTINLNLTGAQSSAGEGSGDIISGFEGIVGSNIGNDVLTGDAGANWLFGYAGNDYLTGGAGGDGLSGGDGYDFVSYYGSTSGVTINLNLSGAQSSAGEGSGDIISGVEGVIGSNIGNDVLTGDAGANWLDGYAGNDYITGGAGADWLLGGDGYDFVSYYGSALGVTINLNLTGAQSSAGEGSGDIISGVEGIIGSNIGNDVLTGDAGANWLNGYAGNDYITGGAGADWLLGGDGNDTFVFSAGFGYDKIYDFSLIDKISLSLGVQFDSFAEIMAVTSQVGSNAVIKIDGADSILLSNFDVTSLTVDNFMFG
jgi:serralysin